jgi:surfeit locus 1 family protein
VWQLHRAEEKRVLLAEKSRQEALPALDIQANTTTSAEDVRYRSLHATGKFATAYRIYIDNKVLHGQVGYQVVEPLVLQAGGEAVLVNRGWVAATASRDVMPEIKEFDAEQTVSGVAKLETRDVASLGAGNRSGENWPALVRWIDIAELQKGMPFQLKPYLLLQTNDNGDGLQREWTFVNSPPEKNQSYAMQWFAMAVVLLFLFGYLNTKKIRH